MFCPTCGKDNSQELKFCAACGTNLEAGSQALTGVEEDFFSKMDSGMDYFIARYAEHVFKDAPHNLAERSVKKSWTILGQAAITSLIDILLFTLMWNLLPLRFMILIISTPFRLLARRIASAQCPACRWGRRARRAAASAGGTARDSGAGRRAAAAGA